MSYLTFKYFKIKLNRQKLRIENYYAFDCGSHKISHHCCKHITRIVPPSVNFYENKYLE